MLDICYENRYTMLVMMRKGKKMKKILIALTLVFGMTNVATATDFDWRTDMLTQNTVLLIVNKVLGGTNDVRVGGGGVVVNTTGAIMNGKLENCWTAPIYDADGNVTYTLQCQ